MEKKYIIMEGDEFGIHPYQTYQLLTEDEAEELMEYTPPNAILYRIEGDVMMKVKSKYTQ